MLFCKLSFISQFRILTFPCSIMSYSLRSTGSKSKYFTPINDSLMDEKHVKKEVKQEVESEEFDSEKFESKTVKVETPLNDSPDEEKMVTKVVKKSTKHVSVKSEIVDEWQPQNWKQVLGNIETMRVDRKAPVDTMGAEKCYDNKVNDKDRRFQVLVSLMLSSQTKDEVTHAAMERLKARKLSVQTIMDMPSQELGPIIKTVGFWNRKTEYIKKVAQILHDDYNDDIPNSLEGLLALPGVGPKMAHLAMKIAWNESTGIAVDTHVHRISNRLGWVRKTTNVPEKTRLELESWLPKEYWDDINCTIVGFGQTICLPIKPKCHECLNNKICPAAFKSNTKKSK